MDHQRGPEEQQDTEQALTKNRNGVAMQMYQTKAAGQCPDKVRAARTK